MTDGIDAIVQDLLAGKVSSALDVTGAKTS